ncbi:MAG: hypothetical protein AABX01_03690 [Candidatus Micrarchaeota archaeon]
MQKELYYMNEAKSSIIEKLRSRKARPEGSLFIPAELDVNLNDRGLKRALRGGLIKPISDYPRAAKEAMERGFDVDRIFLIPMRDPLATRGSSDEQYQARSFHSFLHDSRSGKSPRYYFKGIGAPGTVRGKIRDRAVVGTFSELPEQELTERKFWGGARKGTLLTAIDSIKEIEVELARARRENDPAVKVARKFGGAKPDLPKPYALFRPLQIPLGIIPIPPLKEEIPDFRSMLSGEEEKRLLIRQKTRLGVTMVDTERGLASLGISDPSFVKGMRVMGYTNRGLGLRLFETSRKDVSKIFPALFEALSKAHPGIGRNALTSFAASLGLVAHLLHHRLKKTAFTVRGGSIFSPQNVDFPFNGGASLFDFDVVNNDMANTNGDIHQSISSIVRGGLALKVDKEMVKKAVGVFFDVYYASDPKSRKQVIFELQPVGKKVQ